MLPELNKGENNLWKAFRITPRDPKDWSGQWDFDTRRPLVMYTDKHCQKKKESKQFYLKNFKGTTDAELHKAAISAAAGWRMEQKQKHFCPHPSKVKGGGPVLRTDLGHLIMKFDRGEISLSELLRLTPLWYMKSLLHTKKKAVAEGWFKKVAPASGKAQGQNEVKEGKVKEKEGGQVKNIKRL